MNQLWSRCSQNKPIWSKCSHQSYGENIFRMSLGKFQMTVNWYRQSNVVYMLMLHSRCCINVPIGSRLNTWSGNIWDVPNLLLAGKWWVPSTRAYNVLKMFSLVSRPPHPQCDTSPVHLPKPFSPLDHVGPEPIVKEEVGIDVLPPLIVGSYLVFSSLQNPMEGILGNLQISVSVPTSRNKEGNYLVSQRVVTITQQRGMFPVVPPTDVAQEPTHGQLDDQTTTLLSKDQRSDDWVLHVGHWLVVCWCEKVKASWWDLSAVLRFPLSSSQPTNHIAHHYWSFTQPTHW